MSKYWKAEGYKKVLQVAMFLVFSKREEGDVWGQYGQMFQGLQYYPNENPLESPSILLPGSAVSFIHYHESKLHNVLMAMLILTLLITYRASSMAFLPGQAEPPVDISVDLESKSHSRSHTSNTG